ncbi:hypothetical protein FRC06_007466, partial [Ceratobasidium sp. 370]
MVWTGREAPTTVLIPVINHLEMHCYLWYGDVTRNHESGASDLHLHLLDSLSRPSTKVIDARLAACDAVIRFLLPQVTGDITGGWKDIPGYRQKPGTTDCGWFVCQALSALSYGHENMLYDLLSLAEVKRKGRHILEACKYGALDTLLHSRLAKPPVVLHRRPAAPPPWRLLPLANVTPTPAAPEKTSWVTPVIERSLSEPPGDTRRDNLGHGSWEDVFGSQAALTFAHVSGDAFQGYLKAIDQGQYVPPPGLLAGVGAHLPNNLMKALLLEGDAGGLDWAPEADFADTSDEEGLTDPTSGVGLRRFLRGLSSIPEGLDRSKALFTGQHNNRHLHLNWTKEAVDLEEDWLTAGLDIDSLSLTAHDPRFTSPVVFYAYPPRGSTLTTDNGLSVNFEESVKKLSHIPNFTFGHTGSSNQFRINIFFPYYEKGMNAGKRYITMLNDQDYTQWWEEVVWQAVIRMELLCPPEYRHAATCLRQALPRTYANAKPKSGFMTLAEASKGFRILPELFNLMMEFCRKVVDRYPRLQKFRGFFYHIFGMNLKAIGHEVGRTDGSALLHVFKNYPIVDWSLQNPRDIAVDIGLEINLRDEMLPDDIDGLTLVWNLNVLKQLARAGWRKAHVNSYVHSHVVGGLSANPRAIIALLFFYWHAYMKDKCLTYEHRDHSLGTSFSPEGGLLRSQMYVNETSKLKKTLSTSPGSYGVRMEWRCGVGVANTVLGLTPQLWITRFLQAGAIVSGMRQLSGRKRWSLCSSVSGVIFQVAVRTSDVVKFKVTLLDAYDHLFSRLQLLRPVERSSEPVLLMASVLTYLMHGLVQRPDEM